MLYCLFSALVACAGDASPNTDRAHDAGESGDDNAGDNSGASHEGGTSSPKDAGAPSGSATKDAAPATSAGKDASISKTGSRDGGAASATTTDRGPAASHDAGSVVAEPKDGGDALSSDDDTTAEDDAGSASGPSDPGTRDVNGPCEDLQLVCFDVFDMFILNPSDCMTCNHGMGCQGCAIPFAY